MTLVAIWYEKFDGALWAIADTRVGARHEGQSGREVLTEHAAKLFPLHLVCLQPGASGFFDDVSFARSFGFAFAGDSLPATMTYAVTSACLNGLTALRGAALPSLDDVAACIHRIAKKFLSRHGINFEIAVFGWCPIHDSPKVFRVTARTLSGTPDVKVDQFDLMARGEVLLLGAHKEEVHEHIERFASSNGTSVLRIPKQVLRELVKSHRFDEIGGHIQEGLAGHDKNFRLMYSFQPYEEGQARAGRFIMGLDIDEDIGLIGNHKIGAIGMA